MKRTIKKTSIKKDVLNVQKTQAFKQVFKANIIIMIDFLKLRSSDGQTINKLLSNKNFTECRPLNNYYNSFSHSKGNKIYLHFRKSKENNVTVGYGFVDIAISPHYNKNNYLHNGNDFTPLECMQSINNILNYLGIEQEDQAGLQVVNIEFGLNIIPRSDAKKIYNGLCFYKRTNFIEKYEEINTFKISDATQYKEVKAYLKGLQFAKYPAYKINTNTFRFEIRSKQSKGIKQLGINSVCDLFKKETYIKLAQEIINEWEHVFLINKELSKEYIKEDNLTLMDSCNNVDYWNGLIHSNYRSFFITAKRNYYKKITVKNNLHTEIKAKIIDKLVQFLNTTNSTQRSP